eukprot:COSAG04_NODE_22217_length_359_cov_0.303846_1_plen_63_part_01
MRAGKARRAIGQSLLQQEEARRAGEAAGTSLVQRIRRDSRRRELRTGGLSSAQSWFGWRAHIA